MKVVVDSSSFFFGFIPDSSNEYYTTDSVFKEIRGRRMKESLEMRSEFIKLFKPSENYILLARNSATKTGDIGQLSETDIEIIATAMQLNAKILTNDLAIQNVCRINNIPFESYKSKEIKNEIIWKYKCIGCGKIYDHNLKECSHCGNPLKKFPVKIKSIR